MQIIDTEISHVLHSPDIKVFATGDILYVHPEVLEQLANKSCEIQSPMYLYSMLANRSWGTSSALFPGYQMFSDPFISIDSVLTYLVKMCAVYGVDIEHEIEQPLTLVRTVSTSPQEHRYTVRAAYPIEKPPLFVTKDNNLCISSSVLTAVSQLDGYTGRYFQVMDEGVGKFWGRPSRKFPGYREIHCKENVSNEALCLMSKLLEKLSRLDIVYKSTLDQDVVKVCTVTSL